MKASDKLALVMGAPFVTKEGKLTTLLSIRVAAREGFYKEAHVDFSEVRKARAEAKRARKALHCERHWRGAR